MDWDDDDDDLGLNEDMDEEEVKKIMQSMAAKKQSGDDGTGDPDVSHGIENVEFVILMAAPMPGRGVLLCIGHIAMCRCEGYGFQAVYSSVGYINRTFGSRMGYQLVEDFIKTKETRNYYSKHE